jgi:hypothetical protein
VVLQVGGCARCYQLLTVKTGLVTKRLQLPEAWSDPLLQPKEWKKDMRFSMWNVMSLCRSGSLTTVARQLARYKLYQWVYRRLGGTKRHRQSMGLLFFFLKGKKIHQLGTEFLVHNKIASVFKRV